MYGVCSADVMAVLPSPGQKWSTYDGSCLLYSHAKR
jgi:hypothetical protein